MRRTGGVIPPGKAGLILIAAALVPVAIAACKPLAKKIGKFLKGAGDAAERVMDNSQIAADEVKTETPKAAPKAASKKSAPKKASSKKSPKASAA